MAGDRNVVIRLRGDIGDFQAKMVAAGKSVGHVADKMTGAEKESVKLRQGLTSLGDAGGKIGLAAAAGVGAAVTVAANFEQAMSNVQAATHETASNMELLREAAIQAGADTAFSAGEAAAAIENLAKAGVSTGAILDGGLQGALDLAAAGTMDVAEAAETAAVAMAQFGLDGEQVPHIADLLAAAAGKAQGEVSDMAYALKQGGLVADQVGLSIEETTGALAAFAEKGLIGSDAGTSFKTMLQSLTPTSEKAQGAMEALGINAFDAQGNFIGLAEWAGRLRDGLSELSVEQRNAEMKTIFGADAVRAATVIYEQGEDGIRDWIEAVDAQGFAAETAAIKLDNLKGDLEAFKGSLETALIGAGSGSQGPLRSLVQGATDAVNAFNNLSPAAQSTATALLGVTAVTGGSLWFGSKVVQGVANTREALDNLGLSAGKTGGLLKAVGYSAAGLAALYAAGRAIQALEDSMLDAVPGVEAMTQALLNLRDAEVARQFAEDLGDVGSAIDRVTDAGVRAKGFDFMHGAGRQMSFLATSAEELASKVSGYESFAEAEQDIKALDDALANIVRSGSSETAARVLDDLAAAQGLTADQMKRLQERLPAYDEALAGAANAAQLAADGAGEFGDAADEGAEGLDDFTTAAEGAERAVLELDDAMSALFDGLDLAAALDSWRTSLKEFDDELTGGSGALNRNTEAGQKNREAIRGQIEELRAFAEAEYEATGDVDKLRETLLKGREAILDKAQAAGIGKEALERYMRNLGFTAKEIRLVTRLMKPAVDETSKLNDELDRLSGREVRVKVALDVDTLNGKRVVPGLQEYATGGYTGAGGKYEPAGIVHRGEFVFDAQTTAMFRPFFEELHRTRRLPGYSGGGFVRQVAAQTSGYTGPSTVGLSDGDIQRLALAMSQARPLYGDVHVSGDGSFRREMEMDRQRAALEGRRPTW